MDTMTFKKMSVYSLMKPFQKQFLINIYVKI